MVGQAREGTSDKTGVGRTKDVCAVTVRHKTPGTPCGAGHVGLTHTETRLGRLRMARERRCVGSKNSQMTPTTTSTTPNTPTTGRS